MAVLSTEAYWLNKNMPASKQVEIGNTIDIEFHTLQRNEETEDYELVAASSVSSKLTTLDLTLVRSITPVEISTGVYRVGMPFPADDVDVNTEYYVEFNWSLGGVNKLIREKIRVVADVII